MESSVNALSPVLVEVKVQVPWDRVQKDLDSNFKRLSRTARVRGFRPGKVPTKVLQQLFGKQVRAEVAGSLVEQGLMDAVQKHDLQIVAQPEVEEPTILDGQPLHITAKVEVRPKVDKVDFESLELYRQSAAVADEDVDREIEQLRQQQAEIQVPDPMRPAKEGDLLTLSYTVSLDGVEKPEMATDDRPAELGAGRLLPEFESALLGVKPGDQREVKVTFGEDNPNEELRGKTATFQVQVKELKEKLLPALDDEFAKDCGEYETLADLRKSTRERLEEMAKRRAEMELKDQVIDRLVDRNEIPVPPSMVKQQQQQMFYELAQIMQMGGGAPNFDPAMFQGMEERATRRVRAGLLLGALAKQQGVEVAEADVEAKLGEIAERTGKHIAKIKADYKGERRDQLESQILEQKLMDILLGAATIKDGPAPEAAPAEAGEVKADAPAKKAKSAAKPKKAKKEEGEGEG